MPPRASESSVPHPPGPNGSAKHPPRPKPKPDANDKPRHGASDCLPFLNLYKSFGLAFSINGSANTTAEECPYCSGTKFSVNVETGQFQCLSLNKCGETGNAVTFVRSQYEKALNATTDSDYQRLKAARGFALQTSKRHGLAWDGAGVCWLIPYRNESGAVVTLQRCYPDGRKLALPGFELFLYGVDQLAAADNRADRTLFVVEGPLDCIALDACLSANKVRKRYDILAVPAANVFKPDWTRFLEGYSAVRLCLDNDKAGRDGQDRIARLAREAGVRSKLFALKWPDGTPEKYDVGDLVRDGVGVVNFTRDHCVKVGAGDRKILFVRGDDVAAHATSWFYQRHIPFGTFCSLSGRMGTGKSMITKYLTAKATTGEPLPGETAAVPAFDVLYLTSEDSAGQVAELVKLHGGDLKRLHVHDVAASDDEALLDILDFLEEMEAEINGRGVRLVIVDALNSFVGGDIKTDSKARRTLSGPLQRLARKTGACIIGIRNWGREDAGTASQKALGATSLSDVARCVMNTCEIPDPPEGSDELPPQYRYRLEFEKVSDAPKPEPLGFNIVDRSDGQDAIAHRRVVLWEKDAIAQLMAGLKNGSKKR